MKNIGILILCICLSVAAIIFSLKGRYQVIMNAGANHAGAIWLKCDTLTGRTWGLWGLSGKRYWSEVKDYGHVIPPTNNKVEQGEI
jgi:hypothetical protein